MGDLAPFLSYGPAGVLLLVVLYLLNGNRQDRQQYNELVDAAEKRADNADERRQGAERALDAERTERRRIEDELSREIRGLRTQVEQLTREVAVLRTQVGGAP